MSARTLPAAFPDTDNGSVAPSEPAPGAPIYYTVARGDNLSQANMGRWPMRVDTDHHLTMEFLDTRVPAVALADAGLAKLARSFTI